jgi:hypothetical protein
MAATVTVRRVPVRLVVTAIAVLVAASQAQWGLWRAALALAGSPQHLKWLLAGVSLGGLLAAGPVVRRCPVGLAARLHGVCDLRLAFDEQRVARRLGVAGERVCWTQGEETPRSGGRAIG